MYSFVLSSSVSAWVFCWVLGSRRLQLQLIFLGITALDFHLAPRSCLLRNQTLLVCFPSFISCCDLINNSNCHSLYSLIFCDLVICGHHVSIWFLNHNFIGLKHVENISGCSTGPCRIALMHLEHPEQHSLKHFCNEITAVLQQCPLLLSQAFGWDFSFVYVCSPVFSLQSFLSSTGRE